MVVAAGSRLDFAYDCTQTLPTVAVVSAVVSAVALALFAMQGVVMAAVATPLLLVSVGVTSASVSLLSLIVLIAAKCFVKKEVADIGRLDDAFLDPFTFEPLDETAQFLANDFLTYNLATLIEGKKQYQVRLGNGKKVCLSSATHFPNLAIAQKYTVCPITKRPFVEPYICQEDGHTYEKEAFISHWNLHRTIPGTGEVIYHPHLYPNFVLFPATTKKSEAEAFQLTILGPRRIYIG